MLLPYLEPVHFLTTHFDSSNAESYYVNVLIMLMKQKSNVSKETWRSGKGTLDREVTRTEGIVIVCV